MTGTQLLGQTPVERPDDAPLPTAFGKYRVLSRLGSGGFGSVYRCVDEGLGRDVAVKALSPQASKDADLRDRFLLEARSLARVNHPSVVQVFDVGDSEQGPFFVMELVSGRDLEHVLKDGGPLPEARALALCRLAVQGLQAAAASNVVHRDIKPANLMVTGVPPRENVKVTDFGLAFPTAGTGNRLTAPTTILGTPEYMAPEQARGESVDVRADMYSLGCTLFELLVGNPPFALETPQATLAAHLTQTPDPPRVRRPEVTVPTNNLVTRLLAKDPSGRFANYEELLSALESCLASAPGGAVALSGGTSSGSLTQMPLPPATSPGTSVTRVEGNVLTENLALCFVELLDFQERTRQQTREENSEWVGAFTDGMKRLIRQRGGRFIKQVYGTVLCSFVSPTDAVLFGMACVDAAWGWSRSKPAVMNYQVKVGINLGEVRVERGDVFGDPVNTAARVMTKAGPNEVWFSDAVYLAMNRSEVEAQPVGVHELKGVPVPVRLFSALPMKGHVASDKSPPFGVRGAAAVRAGGDALDALEALDKGARAVAHGMGRAATGALRAGAVVQPVMRTLGALWELLLSRVPSRHRSKVSWGLPLAVVLGVGIPTWVHYSDPYRREVALLDEGKAGAAVRGLETRTAESPRAQWLYGKALIMVGKKPEGLEQWDAALLRDPRLADSETLDTTLSSLDMKNVVGRRILVKHYGKRAVDPLKERVSSERYWVRHHAAQALRELDLDVDVDWTGVYLKDVRLETDCARRREAVRALEDLGDSRALSAVTAARAEPGGDPGCIQDALTGTERRLKKKLGLP